MRAGGGDRMKTTEDQMAICIYLMTYNRKKDEVIRPFRKKVMVLSYFHQERKTVKQLDLQYILKPGTSVIFLKKKKP